MMTNTKQQAKDIWATFCDELKITGLETLEQSQAMSEHDQAEGVRYLTRLLRNGLEFKLEGSQAAWPQLFSYAHETIKMGADNPDIRYLNCHISPQYNYKISGTRGSVNQLNLSTHAGGYAEDSSMRLSASLASEQLIVEADGSIEIFLSQQPQEKNWLPLNKDSNLLIIRQIFLNRDRERAANLVIERVNAADSSAYVLNFNDLQTALQNTCASIKGTASLFTQWADSWRAHSNQLPLADQDYCQSLGGDPQIIYYHSHWALEKDEVLVIHLDYIPACTNWNLQINNIWMESLDYRFHRIHINKHTAVHNKDDSVTIILSHTDPKVPNWLNTTGHLNGTLCFRWVNSQESVQPHIKKCLLSEI